MLKNASKGVTNGKGVKRRKKYGHLSIKDNEQIL
jgi:hypothetical protein